MSNALLRERTRARDEAARQAAYGAWLMGAGGEKTLGEFYEYYGLEGKRPARPTFRGVAGLKQWTKTQKTRRSKEK